MILIDCGESIARKIIKNNILDNIEELYILISHTHSDHIGSLGTLLFYSKYNKKIKNKIILPKDEEYEKNIKEYLRLVDISSEVEFVDCETLKNNFQFINFEMLIATHVNTLPCYFFVFEDEEGLIYYSADNNNMEYIKQYIKLDNAKIYTEICDNQNLQEEHLYIKKLEEQISELERRKIYLMHINEVLNKEDLLKKGFNIPNIERKKVKKYGRKN